MGGADREWARLALDVVRGQPVGLASSSTFLQLLALLGPHKQALKAVDEASAARARRTFLAPMMEFVRFLDERVRESGLLLDVILHEPLVQIALQEALAEAARLAADEVARGWAAGARLGWTHGLSELRVLGVAVPQVDILSVSAYLDTAIARLEILRENMVVRVLTSVDIEAVRGVLRTGATRAALGASSSANRAYSDAQLAVYDAALLADPTLRLQKVWVTNFSPTTCPYCEELNGTVVDVGTQFSPLVDGEPDLPVFYDLQAPPRHPNCQCRLVLFIERPGETGVTPSLFRTSTQVLRDIRRHRGS